MHPPKRWRAFCLALVVLELSLIALKSWQLQLRWNDEIEYLQIARYIVGLCDSFYPNKSVFLPLLMAPLAWITRHDFWLLFHSAGALAAPLGLLSLLAVQNLFRRFVSSGWAWLGSVLLSFNILFVHYAHLISVDVPALGASAWMLSTWIDFHHRRTGRNALLAVLAATATLSLRPNLLVFEGVFAMSLVFFLQRRQFKDALKTAAMGAGAPLFSMLLSAWVYGGIRRYWETQQFWAGMFLQNNWPVYPSDHSYLFMLQAVVAWPVLAAAFYGLWRLWKKSSLHWETAGVFLYFCLGVGSLMPLKNNPEARYLLPFLPSIYCFSIYGLANMPRKPNWLSAAAVIAITATSTMHAWQGLRYFQQGFFTQPFLPQLTRHLDQNTSPEARVVWLNGEYALFPAQLRENWGPVADIYSLTPRTLQNFLHVKVETPHISKNGRVVSLLERFDDWNEMEAFANTFRNGDTVVISQFQSFRADYLPDVIPPLKVLHWQSTAVERSGPKQEFKTSAGNLSFNGAWHWLPNPSTGNREPFLYDPEGQRYLAYNNPKVARRSDLRRALIAGASMVVFRASR